ncbi:hypothetical protein [Roseomonas indoligenes]|uniref:Uncharacterized protein n=1 Tax=Roseomonas indoligenes TaxID=2820811 RepID=A0A940MWF3_9PROT|nr:hypothetical protein [Pararoseomonas indoligenes]MBP0492452.1 hypothetical protein [Pararoseomonas indoligenes]
MQDLDTPPDPRAGRPARGLAPNVVLTAIRDLVQHARAAELPLADELLTDILAKLCGWPVEELNRLR